MPAERVLFGDQQVGQAVAREIDEFQIGIAPVEHRQLLETLEWLPVGIGRALVISRRGTVKVHQVEPPVPGEVHQLLPAAADRRRRWLAVDHLDRRELR